MLGTTSGAGRSTGVSAFTALRPRQKKRPNNIQKSGLRIGQLQSSSDGRTRIRGPSGADVVRSLPSASLHTACPPERATACQPGHSGTTVYERLTGPGSMTGTDQAMVAAGVARTAIG